MRFGAPRTTLAGQFLALQLGIVVTVLVMVAAVSLAQSDARLRQTESRRMLSVAESTAARDIVRAGLQAEGSPEVLAPTAESVRVLSSTDHLIVHDSDGRALTLDPGPGDGGSRAEPGIAPALRGRAWTGVTEIDGNRTVAAAVPVIGEGGAILGVVVAGVDYPGTGELLVLATPNLLVYLGIASVLGVAGSLLLSRRVKRQTLGLEPDQIARLVEHREAMLYGIKEGVLGLNAEHRSPWPTPPPSACSACPPAASAPPSPTWGWAVNWRTCCWAGSGAATPWWPSATGWSPSTGCLWPPREAPPDP